MMSHIHFFYYSNEENNQNERFLDSCSKQNIKPINIYQKTDVPFSLHKKIYDFYQIFQSNKYSKTDIACFTDAWDVLYLNNGKKIQNEFLKINKPVVFSSEENYYNISPNANNILENWHYKNIFLNSGGYIGYIKDILEMLHEIINQQTILNCDQAMFYEFFHKNPTKLSLDVNKTIFGTYYRKHNLISRWIFFTQWGYDCQFYEKNGEVIYKTTQKPICILHHPGKKGLYLNYIAYRNKYFNTFTIEITIKLFEYLFFATMFYNFYILIIPFLIIDKFIYNGFYERELRHKIKYYNNRLIQ